MHQFRFERPTTPAEVQKTRATVRDFLRSEVDEHRFQPHRCSWSTWDLDFSRRAGAAGFIGVTWPPEYGGRSAAQLERYVITEEMLAAGAPCGAHWVADRQSGPQILRNGSDAAKRQILPRIARGECFFAIGMSEAGSGSDLAAVRTKAVRVDKGWIINGTKIWTSGAHRAHYMIALARTGSGPEDRQRGLTQFLIDMGKPGLTVRPIYNLAGDHDFNEVHFEDYFVPDDMLIGREGSGWEMVTRELAFERSGPDRFLSDYRLLVELIDRVGPAPDHRQEVEIGRLVANISTLRFMSTSVAGLLERGEDPQFEAALVKDLGTSFERDLPEICRGLLETEASLDEDGTKYSQALARATLHAPSFTIRGGTREILRGVIARGLGLR
jgi:alkylation response protein AidB-like acyl-CoA dehydrogenase